MLRSKRDRDLVIGVVQRIGSASVSVAGEIVAEVGPGLMVLVGVAHADTSDDARALGSKIAGLRIFGDAEGLMNKSVAETRGEVLVVSQFTLLGDTRRGRRPSFIGAASPDQAARLIDEVQQTIAAQGLLVKSGVFGAHMSVQLVNDGPVTVILRTASGRIA